jgi:glc operon protein GlcG
MFLIGGIGPALAHWKSPVSIAADQGHHRGEDNVMPTRRGIPLACATALLLGGLAIAQAQTPAPAPVPEAMPFDIPYGSPIDLDTANKAIMAAAAEAKKHNWKMAISVVGPAGQLIAHATMDGTMYASIDIAQAKARTAALFRRPSKAFADAINGGGPGTLSLLELSHSAASEGGFPIVVDGRLIGAIGASGGIATQDGVTAKAGLDAVTPH